MPKPPALVGGASPPALTDVLTSASGYAAEEKAAATRRAYRSDWRHFEAWCTTVHHSAPLCTTVHHCDALPAEPATVAAYLAHLADSGLKASTISRRLAAIAYAHKLSGCDSPTSAEAVHAVLRGIRRTIGVAPVRKAPATAKSLESMLNFLPDSLRGLRDRALLLIGFAAALRRSEIVDLKVNDLEFHPDGLLLHIRRSKTDQEGEGAAIAIPRGGKLKPVEALEAWLGVLKIDRLRDGQSGENLLGGPVFRPIDRHGRIGAAALTDRSVASIVKRYAAAAGLDPKLFSGHSLRAGFVTSALECGADVLAIMRTTRHNKVDTLKAYDRRANLFKDHAGKDFL